jgi:decaprenylphospho-beta-D-ribofuranose 2-oxidase
MPITIDDSLGLNRVELQSMPIANAPADIANIVDRAAPTSISVVGSRHSQGGHTVANHGVAILTEPMNRVFVNYDASGIAVSVTAQAGATWNVLHAVLAPLGYAPLVQQSSPHFTVGGSISVNCHGRDPRQGPLSTCVQSMEVLVPGEGQKTTHPGDELFKAVVGGYGSAGIILTATLRIGPNVPMRQQAKEMPLSDYAQKLLAMQASTAARLALRMVKFL